MNLVVLSVFQSLERRSNGGLSPANLGNRLREARERRGLSQQQAAEQLDVPETTVILIESGSGTVSTLELVRLAEICRFGVSEFFNDESSGEAEDLKDLERECDVPLMREEDDRPKREEGRELVRVLALLEYLDEMDSDSPDDQELRNRMIRLALEAYRREEISRGRLLDLSKKLRVPGQTLLRWAEAARESDDDQPSEEKGEREVGKCDGNAGEAMPPRLFIERRAFLKLPLEERRRLLAEQARKMVSDYEQDPEWREWLRGDIVER